MSVLDRRLQTGLNAVKEGDLEFAEDIIQELASPTSHLNPIAGLDPSTEVAFHELVSVVATKKKDIKLALHAAEQHRIAAEADEEALEYDFDADEEFSDEDAFADDSDELIEDAELIEWDEEPSFEDVYDTEDEEDWEVVAEDTADSSHSACSCSSHTHHETSLAPSSQTGLNVLVPVTPDDRVFVESVLYRGPDSSASVVRTRVESAELETNSENTAATMRTVHHLKASVALAEDEDIPEAIAERLDLAANAKDRTWDELHIEEMHVVKTTLVFRDGTRKQLTTQTETSTTAYEDDDFYEEIME